MRKAAKPPLFDQEHVQIAEALFTLTKDLSSPLRLGRKKTSTIFALFGSWSEHCKCR